MSVRFVQSTASMHANFETNGTPGKPSARRNGTQQPPKASFLRAHLSELLLLPDLLILYAAFVGALSMHLGAWTLPQEAGLGTACLVNLGVYVGALALSGLYRTPPRAIHLSEFLRAAGILLLAGTLSAAFTRLASPAPAPPHSILAMQGLFSVAGILGGRALLRQGLERLQPANPAPSIQISDLLPREPVAVETASLRDYLGGRTVLVTGAGGSIGTELAHQLARLVPRRLVLVDVSEYNLFQLEHAFREKSFDGKPAFRLADVRDEAVMDELFSDFRPDVVLHAAAYKHVPLMERHPIEAFRNNALATRGLVRLCEAYDTEQFVFVSTDKAVAPASVLGATKRLAEWYVRCADLPCKIVRFGNVFGSRGSVVPLFEEQIAAGAPAPVTHPEMKRYFMSAHEACSLILQTLLLDEAPTYIFEMGEAVRIEWLAREIARRLQPGADPEAFIEYTGIRPGEKLQEQLWTEKEHPIPTAHDHIVGLKGPEPHSRTVLEQHFDRLEELSRNRRTAALRKALFSTTLDPAPEHTVNGEQRIKEKG